MNINLTIPLPPKHCKPRNRPYTRQGQVILGKQIKKYRKEVGEIAEPLSCWAEGVTSVRILATIYHRDKRGIMDQDNAIAWLKPAFDGLQDGLGINDKHFEPHVEQRTDKNNPRVIITAELRK